MFSSTLWMNAEFAEAAAEPEGEEAAAAACGAAVAHRMVVGSRDVVEVESLGARRDRFVGEMGPLRLRPCAVPTPPPGYVNSWKTRCRLGKRSLGERTANVRLGRLPQLTGKMKGSQTSCDRGWLAGRPGVMSVV